MKHKPVGEFYKNIFFNSILFLRDVLLLEVMQTLSYGIQQEQE